MHDSDEFESLIRGKNQSVYANKKRRRMLESKCTYCGILEKDYRNHLLTIVPVDKNKQLLKIRNIVERQLAYMKHILKYERCSYYGFAGKRFQFIMNAIVYNMRRFLTLCCAVA